MAIGNPLIPVKVKRRSKDFARKTFNVGINPLAHNVSMTQVLNLSPSQRQFAYKKSARTVEEHKLISTDLDRAQPHY